MTRRFSEFSRTDRCPASVQSQQFPRLYLRHTLRKLSFRAVSVGLAFQLDNEMGRAMREDIELDMLWLSVGPGPECVSHFRGSCD
jgi:hypothetical protein